MIVIMQIEEDTPYEGYYTHYYTLKCDSVEAAKESWNNAVESGRKENLGRFKFHGLLCTTRELDCYWVVDFMTVEEWVEARKLEA